VRRAAWILVLTACGERAPQSPAASGPIELVAGGLTLRVERAPYAVSIADAAGHTLRTLGAGNGDGYAALGFARGVVHWRQLVSPGYFDFDTQLEPYADRWQVATAKATADAIAVTLVPCPAAPSGCGVADPSGPAVTVTHTLRPGALRVEASTEGPAPRAWSAAFASPPSEGFLGFGERFGRTDQRGQSVYVWAEEGGLGTGEADRASRDNPYPNGEQMSYYPVPFFLSTAGYGFWLDSTWRSTFDLAAPARPDALRVWHIGPRLAYEVYLPDAADPRPWPYQLIDRFTATTGRPMRPPAWALGPRRRVGPGAQVMGVPELQAMRDQDLAITSVDDTLHFLPMGSHVGREADRRAWTASTEALGVRSEGYYNPYLADTPENPLRALVDEGIAKRYFLADAMGVPSKVWLISGRLLEVLTVDFTSPEATAWYQGFFQWMRDLGYHGFMYDFGEYVQPEVLAANGMSGEELHNLFPVLYDQAVHDAMEASSLRGNWLARARSGFTGSSHWVPMMWMGDPAASFEDSDGLPTMVRGAINLGASGVPFAGGDIGGFHCIADGAKAADGELLTRWIQQGALLPNMQDQDACSGNTGSDGAKKATIWSSADARAAWRTYAKLHTRLFPYLRALAEEASATGAPIVRSLFLEHPDRREYAAVDDAHYFGPSLLVAPVVARGAREKRVTLPPGAWLDWADHTLLTGGEVVTVAAPLDKLPLYLRDGHLVPLLDASIDTLVEGPVPGVVTPRDVADMLDVVGLVTAATGRARFQLAAEGDGGATLEAVLAGPVDVSALPAAADDAAFASCMRCARTDALPGGLLRVRVSATGDVAAGGLALRSSSARRIRWDLHVRTAP